MEDFNNTLYYDGSFNGFLTVLYHVDREGLQVEELCKMKYTQDVLFPQPHYVPTRTKLAELIWKQLRERNYTALKTLYFAFMSEEKNIEKILLRFFRVWRKKKGSETDVIYGTEFRELYRLAAEVEREKIATERKLLMESSREVVCVKSIRPRYNVLPLISRYLRTRYRESEWVVFDLRRNYGLHHKHGSVAFIPFKAELQGNGTRGLQESGRKTGTWVKKKDRSRHIPAMA